MPLNSKASLSQPTSKAAAPPWDPTLRPACNATRHKISEESLTGAVLSAEQAPAGDGHVRRYTVNIQATAPPHPGALYGQRAERHDGTLAESLVR